MFKSAGDWPDERRPGPASRASPRATHEPRLDDLTLMEAVRTQAFYIGAIGPQRISSKRIERLTRPRCPLTKQGEAVPGYRGRPLCAAWIGSWAGPYSPWLVRISSYAFCTSGFTALRRTHR